MKTPKFTKIHILFLALALQATPIHAGMFSAIDDFFGGFARGSGETMGKKFTNALFGKHQNKIITGGCVIVGLIILRHFYIKDCKRRKKIGGHMLNTCDHPQLTAK